MTSRQYVEKLFDANFQRTEYILNNYLHYKALEKHVENNVSHAFFDLVASQMEGKEEFDNQDKTLINKAGPYLLKTIDEAIDSIKRLPLEISNSVYPAIYYYYLFEVSKGTTKKVAELMLVNDQISVTEDEICQLLEKGIRMLSALLFDERYINAIKEGNK